MIGRELEGDIVHVKVEYSKQEPETVPVPVTVEYSKQEPETVSVTVEYVEQKPETVELKSLQSDKLQ